MVREVSRGVLWFWGAIALILVTGAVLWGVKVLASETKGQGDAVIQKNSAENWVQKQELFEELEEGVKTTDAKIAIKRETLAQDPDNVAAKTELAGLQSGCLDLVGRYNAEADKFSSAEFRSADLPEEIDTTNPSTDCK